MESSRHANRLIHEKSPYLLQHAYNPVDWYPWGEEAFAKARAQDKPIFLSIGYSTCHWCHVMERESFEVDSIASIMNEFFVCIKVDREERPDVDKVYMTALQAMGENGGWPMSMFLTPDREPFHGGTYFPPETRYGRIGFPELLRRIADIWKHERKKVTESAGGITSFLRQLSAQRSSSELDTSLMTLCFDQAVRNYDSRFGGFGDGPKFPRPVVFQFLLRYFHRTGDRKALDITAHTLRAMAEGGMYDQIGGGFHRYSVDGEWRVPHFEKMLYDQAQIVSSLADVYLITQDNFFERIMHETLAYVLRDMTSEDGAFFSAEDADSPLPDAPEENSEGAFYVWTNRELDSLLGVDAKAFDFYYGVEENGNALNDPQHEFTGKNILYVSQTLSETARFAGISEDAARTSLERSREKLFSLRSRRPRPHLDDKVITAWNGLMITALARAAQVSGASSYLRAAERAAEFIVSHLYDFRSHTLLRRYRDGEAKFSGNLDDYAFFVQGLLDLYETSFDIRWLRLAMDLTRKQVEVFYDTASGGFFDTPGDDPAILVRMKEQYDGAEPTGNSVAVMNLLRLSHMTGNDGWRTRADETLKLFGETLRKAPFTLPYMVSAFEFSSGKAQQIVIAGSQTGADTREMVREVHSRFLPNKVLVLAPGGEGQQALAQYVPFIEPLRMIDGKATAYICEDFVCQLPTSDRDTMIGMLGQR